MELSPCGSFFQEQGDAKSLWGDAQQDPMKDLLLLRFLHLEPREVGSDLHKQCSLLTPVPPVLLSRRRTMLPKKVRLYLGERQHLPTLPSAQGEVWLCRKMGSFRASCARQVLLLGPGRGSLAEAGGAHLELRWFRRPCWARMGQRSPIGLRLPILWVLSPEEKRFPFFQLRAASSKPFASGRVVFSGWVYICPPWSHHQSSAHKALCHGQSKTDTQIETERRKKKTKGVTQIRKS